MLGVLVAVAMSTLAAVPSEADWDWLTEHRPAAFEALMPVTSVKSPLATYRSYRDLYQEVPERYFAIRHGHGLEALVVVPDGPSIQQQLLDLHMAEPAASLDNLLPRVRIRRVELMASTCPAIQSQLDRLSRLRFTVPAMDLIILHPELHHVIVDAGGGRVDATLQQDEHPLVRWSLETLAALQRCPAVQ
jgi:hypothetical protein